MADDIVNLGPIDWSDLTEEQRNWLDEGQLDWNYCFHHALESLPGYAGLQWRERQREFAVYATGEPDAAVSALIGRAPRGISVTWHDAPYAFEELDAEVQRLMGEHPTIVTGGANSDGTGILLGTTDPQLGSAPDPARLLGAKFPVTVEYGPHEPMPA